MAKRNITTHRVTLDSGRPRTTNRPASSGREDDSALVARLGRFLGDIPARSYAMLVLGVALAAGLVAGCHYGSRAVSRAFLLNPDFAITNVVVRGNRSFSSDEIQRLAGIQHGRSLYAYNLPKMRASTLRRAPALQDLSLTCILPGTLVLNVAERIPLARVSLKNPLRTIDEDGIVFYVHPGRAADSASVLPIILSKELGDLDPGLKADEKVCKVLRVLKVFNSIRVPFDIQFIETSDSNYLILRTLRNGPVLRIPWQGLTTTDTMKILFHRFATAMQKDMELRKNSRVFTASFGQSGDSKTWQIIGSQE